MSNHPVQWRAIAAERGAVRPAALDPPHVPAQFCVPGWTVEYQGNLALTVGELRGRERIIDIPLDRHLRDEAQLDASGHVPCSQSAYTSAVEADWLRRLIEGIYGTQWSLAVRHAPIMPGRLPSPRNLGRSARLDLEVVCRRRTSLGWNATIPVDVLHDPRETVW